MQIYWRMHGRCLFSSSIKRVRGDIWIPNKHDNHPPIGGGIQSNFWPGTTHRSSVNCPRISVVPVASYPKWLWLHYVTGGLWLHVHTKQFRFHMFHTQKCRSFTTTLGISTKKTSDLYNWMWNWSWWPWCHTLWMYVQVTGADFGRHKHFPHSKNSSKQGCWVTYPAKSSQNISTYHIGVHPLYEDLLFQKIHFWGDYRSASNDQASLRTFSRPRFW